MVRQLNRKQERVLWCLTTAYVIGLVRILFSDEGMFSRALIVTMIFGVVTALALYQCRTQGRFAWKWRQLSRQIRVLGAIAGICLAVALGLFVITGVVAEFQDQRQSRELRTLGKTASNLAEVVAAYEQEVEKLPFEQQTVINEVIKRAWAGERVTPIRPIPGKDGKTHYRLTDFLRMEQSDLVQAEQPK